MRDIEELGIVEDGKVTIMCKACNWIRKKESIMRLAGKNEEV